MKIARDNILLWTFAGVAVLVLLGLLIGLRYEELLLPVIIGACVGMAAWSSFNRASTWARSGYSGLSPVEVRAVARDLLDAPGWRLKRQEPNLLTFERRVPLGLPTAVILALLGLIPLVIYLVAGNNRYQTVSLLTAPEEDATLVELTFRPKGDNGRNLADRFFERLDAFELDGTPPSRGVSSAARASAI